MSRPFYHADDLRPEGHGDPPLYLDCVWTPDEPRLRGRDGGRPVLERELDYRAADPLDLLTPNPWEQTATECLSTVYWVRDEEGLIQAVAFHRPGADPAHPDLVVHCRGEVYVYRYEQTPESYRARLYAHSRLPTPATL